MRLHPSIVVLSCLAGLAAVGSRALAAAPEDGQRLLTIDHYVTVRSTAPAMAGQTAQIYVRERVQAGTALRGPTTGARVVLFIHGAGTPAEVAFDTPHEDYSCILPMRGSTCSPWTRPAMAVPPGRPR
jgi:hypothetical protein